MFNVICHLNPFDLLDFGPLLFDLSLFEEKKKRNNTFSLILVRLSEDPLNEVGKRIKSQGTN